MVLIEPRCGRIEFSRPTGRVGAMRHPRWGPSTPELAAGLEDTTLAA